MECVLLMVKILSMAWILCPCQHHVARTWLAAVHRPLKSTGCSDCRWSALLERKEFHCLATVCLRSHLCLHYVWSLFLHCSLLVHLRLMYSMTSCGILAHFSLTQIVLAQTGQVTCNTSLFHPMTSGYEQTSECCHWWIWIQKIFHVSTRR